MDPPQLFSCSSSTEAGAMLRISNKNCQKTQLKRSKKIFKILPYHGSLKRCCLVVNGDNLKNCRVPSSEYMSLEEMHRRTYQWWDNTWNQVVLKKMLGILNENNVKDLKINFNNTYIITEDHCHKSIPLTFYIYSTYTLYKCA